MFAGFGLSGFRSFGPDPQFFAPLSKVNIVVGQNNAGKSNVLRALRHLNAYLKNPRGNGLSYESVDRHRGRQSDQSWFLPLDVNGTDIKQSLLRDVLMVVDEHFRAEAQMLGEKLIASIPPTPEGRWTSFDATSPQRDRVTPNAAKMYDLMQSGKAEILTFEQWKRLWAYLNPRTSGGDAQGTWIPQVLNSFCDLSHHAMPNVAFIDAHRQIGQPGSVYAGLSGQGLISRLGELQSPDFEKIDEEQPRFEAINRFVETVMERPGARLYVPQSAKEIQVQIGGRRLPLQSLGTGIHQVIIFAVAATVVEGEILCIEEPEVHLHPRFQKQLLSYLVNETSNQYFITTHSAHLLDSSGAAVFHVRLNEHDESVVTRISSPAQRFSICRDLGYRASDLVQANAVVWVEGPSDRTYLTAWLKEIDSGLEEGIHFSVMFYGGRLLAHLTANDEDVNDFIALQKLNRHVAILIDSDRRNAGDVMNATKDRIKAEVERDGGFCWVTAGREVENYIAPDRLKDALADIHPGKMFKSKKGQFDCLYEGASASQSPADKVKLARVLACSVDLDVLDLRQRVTDLAAFIRACNK